jgi:NAD(P)-dependent dehydrogenase (short-subunit alcohol dehydrogenase family)
MDNGNRPVVLVTGGTGDLGSAIGERFAAGGYRTAVSFLNNADKAERIKGRLHLSGGDVLTVRGDVASDFDCRQIGSEVVSAWGRLDTLVNNASYTKFVSHDDLDGLDPLDFQATSCITIIGSYQMVRAAAPHLRHAGSGSVVNIFISLSLERNGELDGVRGVEGGFEQSDACTGALARTRYSSQCTLPSFHRKFLACSQAGSRSLSTRQVHSRS